MASEKGVTVEMVHKKIYLADSQLAWEHEQFAMNKFAGMTVSALDSHKSTRRASALDTRYSQLGHTFYMKGGLTIHEFSTTLFALPSIQCTHYIIIV